MVAMVKFFVSGGGTGGHFFPSLALLEEMLEMGINAVFVGSKRGIEYKMQEFIKTEKIFLQVYPFVGRGALEKLKALLAMVKEGLSLSMKMDRASKSIVFGGYASLPLGFASIVRGIPLYIHEQNSVPSLTNRTLSKFSKRIFITFEYSRRHFPKEKTIKTGLPVRKTLLESLSLDRSKCRESLGLEDETTLLVMGGSLGASFLNQLAMDLFSKLRIQGIHITGEKEYEKIKSFYEGKNLKVLVLPFSHNMGLIYRASDVAISRAGASSITELSLFGVPSLFIPFPFSAGDHQYHNALEIYDLGGAVVLRQEEASSEKVLQSLDGLLTDREVYSKNISRFADPNASKEMLKYMLKEGYHGG